MAITTPQPSREERRARSHRAILDAARALFSEHGYEQTTVRAVAARAGVDPGLVMQHFGSKEALFGAVSRMGIGIAGALQGPAELLGERLVRHVLADVEGREDGSLPVLRSMLTYPQAAETVRCAVSHPQDNPLVDVLAGPDARLRAALAGTLVLGLLVGRQLLRVPEVAEADAERLARLLGPCLQPLLQDAPPSGGPSPAQPSASGAPSGAPSALEELAAAERARVRAAEEVDRAARAALAAGASYGEVGRALGVSRQAARKRWPTPG